MRKEKDHAGVTKIHGKNESSSVTVEEGKESHAAFALAPETAEVMHTVYECLVKMEKASNLWVEHINRKHV